MKGILCCFLVLTLAALCGCANKPTNDKKAGTFVPDRIQGKAQVLVESGGSMDNALNAGGSSVYIWEGMRRYRLYLRSAAEFVHGDEYVIEGINAQKAIDEMGDPDQGKNGYPLLSSCERVVRTVWSGLAMDQIDLRAQVLRNRVQRYPARPVFLVTKISTVKPADGAAAAAKKKDAAAKEKSIPEVEVAAEKQRAMLVEGPLVHPAPLWEPAGGTVRCKVIIGPEGKISELATGQQLCETVPWAQFRYQPSVQRGRPVQVSTEVEVRFDPRK